MNHYDYLEKNFPTFLNKLGIDFNSRCSGIIVCHGDKCDIYRSLWKDNNIPFEHGVSIYLL